jgi:hypothetical protein
LPGRVIYTGKRLTIWGIKFGNWADHDRSRAVVSHIVDSEGNRFRPLSGLFGTFWLLDSGGVRTDLPKERAYYIGHQPESIGEFTTRVLPITALFWLTVGCLTSSMERHIGLTMSGIWITKISQFPQIPCKSEELDKLV